MSDTATLVLAIFMVTGGLSMIVFPRRWQRLGPATKGVPLDNSTETLYMEWGVRAGGILILLVAIAGVVFFR